MSIYHIKRCKEEDILNLMAFIEKHWSSNHVFTRSKELLRFQHFDYEKNEYNYFLGINRRTDEIDGVVGLIPLAQYDNSLREYDQAWGAIWKVRSDIQNEDISLLGPMLFEKFQAYKIRGGIGMSNIATKIYKRLHYTTCTLNQYFLLNKTINDFHVANMPTYYEHSTMKDKPSEYFINTINDITEITNDDIACAYWPRKSLKYLLNRFQMHPVYNYQFLGIYNLRNDLKTILVTRAISVHNCKVIRIVDVYGPLENIGSIKHQLMDLLEKENAEYIDIMNSGIPESVFTNLGLEQLDLLGDIIIPNYFEPFIRNNVAIEAGYKSPHNDYVIFKADADQDRPSIVD